MAKHKGSDHGKFEKGGYRPLNEGYSPTEKKGYVPKTQGSSLPKAPAGGTGQTSTNKPSGIAKDK